MAGGEEAPRRMSIRVKVGLREALAGAAGGAPRRGKKIRKRREPQARRSRARKGTHMRARREAGETLERGGRALGVAARAGAAFMNIILSRGCI